MYCQCPSPSSSATEPPTPSDYIPTTQSHRRPRTRHPHHPHHRLQPPTRPQSTRHTQHVRSLCTQPTTAQHGWPTARDGARIGRARSVEGRLGTGRGAATPRCRSGCFGRFRSLAGRRRRTASGAARHPLRRRRTTTTRSGRAVVAGRAVASARVGSGKIP